MTEPQPTSTRQRFGFAAAGLRVRRDHARHHPADADVRAVRRPHALRGADHDGHLLDLRRRRAGRAAGVRPLVRRASAGARCCSPARCSRWPARWCSWSPTTCRCCWWAGCCRDCRRASSPAPRPPRSSRPPRRDRRDRATAIATVANIGGLGAGPLVAGVLVQYAPAPAAAVVRRAHRAGGARRRRGAAGAGDVVAHRTHRPAAALGARRDAAGVRDRGDGGVRRLRRHGPVHGRRAVVRRRSVIGIDNHAVAGVVASSIFVASAIAQLSARRMPPRRAVAVGCAILVVGMAILAVALHFSSLPRLIAAAVVAGIGQGISFSRGLAAVVELAPRRPPRRGQLHLLRGRLRRASRCRWSARASPPSTWGCAPPGSASRSPSRARRDLPGGDPGSGGQRSVAAAELVSRSCAGIRGGSRRGRRARACLRPPSVWLVPPADLAFLRSSASRNLRFCSSSGSSAMRNRSAERSRRCTTGVYRTPGGIPYRCEIGIVSSTRRSSTMARR